MTVMDQPQALQNPAIDKERLRQRFLEERNKRLRPDGNDQYLRVAGQLAHYLDDPYTPVTERDPKTDHVTFYASGFEVGTEYRRHTGFDLTGRGGVKLSEHWAAGMRTKHGIHVHGFPFFVQPTQGANLISNVPHDLTESARTIALVIRHARANGFKEIEVTREAEDRWVELLLTGAGRMIGSPDCTPGYYNNEGREPGPAASPMSAIPPARWPISDMFMGGATAASSRDCSFADAIFSFYLRKGVHNNEPTSHDRNIKGISEGRFCVCHRAARGDAESVAILRRRGFRRRRARFPRHDRERKDHVAAGQGGLESRALWLSVRGRSAADG